jgi:hypothetical protein
MSFFSGKASCLRRLTAPFRSCHLRPRFTCLVRVRLRGIVARPSDGQHA